MRPYVGGYRARADRGDADIAAPAFLNQGLYQCIGSILGCGIGAAGNLPFSQRQFFLTAGEEADDISQIK